MSRRRRPMLRKRACVTFSPLVDRLAGLRAGRNRGRLPRRQPAGSAQHATRHRKRHPGAAGARAPRASRARIVGRDLQLRACRAGLPQARNAERAYGGRCGASAPAGCHHRAYSLQQRGCGSDRGAQPRRCRDAPRNQRQRAGATLRSAQRAHRNLLDAHGRPAQAHRRCGCRWPHGGRERVRAALALRTCQRSRCSAHGVHGAADATQREKRQRGGPQRGRLPQETQGVQRGVQALTGSRLVRARPGRLRTRGSPASLGGPARLRARVGTARLRGQRHRAHRAGAREPGRAGVAGACGIGDRGAHHHAGCREDDRRGELRGGLRDPAGDGGNPLRHYAAGAASDGSDA